MAFHSIQENNYIIISYEFLVRRTTEGWNRFPTVFLLGFAVAVIVIRMHSSRIKN